MRLILRKHVYLFNFISFPQALLGNRYGYQCFPAKVAADEFEIMLAIASESKPEYAELLSSWFWRDENAIPAQYVLQVRYCNTFIIRTTSCISKYVGL